jgi:hypothetical protein
MPRAVRFARDGSLRVSHARAGGHSDADEGDRRNAPELGLAADPRAAALGLHPDLMPLELRGIRAINGLHSSDRVQRIP